MRLNLGQNWYFNCYLEIESEREKEKEKGKEIDRKRERERESWQSYENKNFAAKSPF